MRARRLDALALTPHHRVEQLLPIVRSRTARAVARHRACYKQDRCSCHDIDDLTQDVFLLLWMNDARILRSWDPARGLSLPNFVGLVAERAVAKLLRRSRYRWLGQLPHSEEWTETRQTAESSAAGSSPEAAAVRGELLARAREGLRQRLSRLHFRVFEMLLEGHSTDTICDDTGLSRDAVYAWRSRLPKLLDSVARTAAGQAR